MSTEEPKTTEMQNQEEEMPGLESQDGPKLNRGEKKTRKALTKLGMKAFAGITRVAIKRRDGMIFTINEPEVLISGDSGNQFVCFGELKYDDPNQRLQAAEAQRMAAAQSAQAAAASSAGAAPKKNEKKAASNEKPESEEGLTPNHINMVMEHTSCTRNEAIKALREANDDMINAVMKLSGS